MQKYLKAIIALEIFVLIWQYYFRNNLAELKNKKQNYASMYESSIILEQKIGDKTKKDLYLEILKQEREQLKTEKEEMERIIPDMQITRDNMFAPFDDIKKKLNETVSFSIVPEKEYKEEGNLVYWRYDLETTDTFANIVKIIAAIESSETFIRVLELSINSKGSLVDLIARLEVAYRQTLPQKTNGALK